jgi:hypothetical protein
MGNTIVPVLGVPAAIANHPVAKMDQLFRHNQLNGGWQCRIQPGSIDQD